MLFDLLETLIYIREAFKNYLQETYGKSATFFTSLKWLLGISETFSFFLESYFKKNIFRFSADMMETMPVFNPMPRARAILRQILWKSGRPTDLQQDSSRPF